MWNHWNIYRVLRDIGHRALTVSSYQVSHSACELLLRSKLPPRTKNTYKCHVSHNTTLTRLVLNTQVQIFFRKRRFVGGLWAMLLVRPIRPCGTKQITRKWTHTWAALNLTSARFRRSNSSSCSQSGQWHKNATTWSDCHASPQANILMEASISSSNKKWFQTTCPIW